MRESELLEHIARVSSGMGGDVLVGPGDDAAVVRVGGETLLLTVDQLVEGRHYEPGTPHARIAHKAVARSVSDVAAMGGRPRFALATAALPAGFEGAAGLFDLMREAAGRMGCPLVGGDIAMADGPAHFTTTVIGVPHPARGAVLRSGARVGDGVFVTGAVGGAVASGRHLTFTPRVEEAASIVEALGVDLHAMIDLSDGLGRDAARVARASGVRVEIDAGLVPLGEGAGDLERAVAEGEDYELFFTAAADHVRGATRIGVVLEGAGAVMRVGGGGEIDLESLGWDHGS